MGQVSKQDFNLADAMNLREGEDYRLEDGLLVFTASYLARRGSCCGNGCRHCPYVPRHGGEGARLQASEPEPS